MILSDLAALPAHLSSRRPVAVILVLFAAACSGGGLPLDEGIPLELAQHRAATISDVQYDIALQIPAEMTSPIQGTSTITFQWSDSSTAPVVVDFKDPAERVNAVSVNGVQVGWDARNDHVVLDGALFDLGENTVELAYRAGDEALNRSDEFLYTLFVPDRAHFSLPVFDQPDLKARVSWDLTIPSNWVAVGNGAVREMPAIPADLAGDGVAREMVENVPAEGTRRWRMIRSRPIPTYLMAFAAGRFQVETARRGKFFMTMFHRETDADAVARNRDAIFDLHGSALDWMEDYADVDYPFQKLDFVLLPPFQYGGMEHPGSIFYRQSSLMLDESATQSNYLGRASLIAHEVAHMWFGDLVTMKWFDDVWTKEVFANFMAAKVVQPAFPEVDHALRFLTAHHPRAYSVDRTPGANPIRQPLENLNQAGSLYGPIIYQKAPVVMAQLERTVGEDAFREGMREYLRAFPYANASWPDLIEILDRLSPEDLAAWSQVWVEEPGRPAIHVGWASGDSNGGVLTLRQEDAWGRGRVWPQELTVLVSQRGQVGRHVVLLAGEEARVAVGGPEPEWILPMGSGLEYGLFLLPDAQLEGLRGRVMELTEPLHRGGAWLILRDAMLEEQLPPGVLLETALAALEGEDDEILLGQILGLVSSIYWRFLPEEERLEAAAGVEEALWAGLESAGEGRVKAAWFSAWRGLVTTREGVDRLRAIWSGDLVVPGVPLSESQEIAMAESLAVRGVPDAEDILDRQLARIANPDRRDRFNFVRPALSGDPDIRRGFFDSLTEPANREREPWVLSGLGYLQHPLRRTEGAHLVPDGLALVEEIQATGDIFFPGRWMDALLGSHNDPVVWEYVTEFLEAHPQFPERLRGKLLQSADGVRRAARAVHGAGAAPEWATWPES